MHGTVKNGNAYIYFNVAGGYNVEGAPASDVADLLHRFEVPYVVLNACESARATSGDNANVAQVFRSRGVNEVLAMSFKVSNEAARIYLSEFYRQVFVCRVPFATASRIARRSLRESPTRSARFGLSREIIDWFVPVVYGSTNDSALAPLSIGDGDQNGANDSVYSRSDSSDNECLGRDFDLLRLERMVVAERVVFLTGPAGIGKTSLLEYAGKIWRETSFADAIIHVNFSIPGLDSRDALLDVIMEQMSGILPSACSYATTPESDDIETDYRMLALAEYLEAHRVFLIFDSLQHSHTFRGTERSGSKNLLGGGINGVLRQLVSFASPLRSNPCYILFADRRDSYVYMDKQLGCEFKEPDNVYRLGGLELADALELSHLILQAHGEDIAEAGKTATDQLELVIGALEGIPDALFTILPLRKNLNIPWPSFHDFLLHGTGNLAQPSLANPNPTIWNELSQMKITTDTDIFASLMLLGLYWREGPELDQVIEYVEKSGIGVSSQACRTAYITGLDMGFISLSKISGTWIHPEFTLFARSPKIWDDSQPFFNQEPPGILRSLAKGFRWLTSSPSQRAARLAAAALSADPDTLSSTDDGAAFLQNWMAERQQRYLGSRLAEALCGTDYKDTRDRYAPSHRNILCAIHICLAAGSSISLDQWPVLLFQTGCSNVRVICTPAEATIFADAFGRLAHQAINQLGGIEVPPKWQCFVLVLLSYLAATYHNEILLQKERCYEYLNLALEVIEASEARFGAISDWTTTYARGLPFRYKTIHCLEAGDIEGARKYWRLSDDNDKVFMAAKDAANRALSEAGASLNLPPNALEVVQQFQLKLKQGSITEAFVEARREAFSGVIEAAIGEIQQGHGWRDKQAAYDQMYRSSRGLKHVHDKLQIFGFTGLQAQTRWWPGSFDVSIEMQKKNRLGYRLSELESATDAGDTAEALEHHKALFMKALGKGDLDESVEQISEIRQIHVQEPLLKSELPRIDVHYRTWKTMQEFLGALSSQETTSSPPSVQLNFVDNMLDTLRTQGVPTDAIRGLEICRELVADSAISDPAGLAAELRVMFKKMTKVLLRQYSDPGYAEKFAAFGLDTQVTYQKINIAWKSQDYGSLPDLLDKLLEMAQTELGKALLEPEDIKKDKERALWWGKWKGMLPKWAACMNDNPHDFEGGLAHLRTFAADETIQGMKTPDDAAEVLKSTFSQTERLYVDNEFTLAGKDVLTDATKSITIYDNLISELQGGRFTQYSDEELVGVISRAKYNKFLALTYKAFREENWASAQQNIQAATGLNNELNSAAKAHLKDLTETCEAHLANAGLTRADFECRYGDALGHLAKLEALAEEQERTPSVERVFCPKLAKATLQPIRQKLEFRLGLVEVLGEEVGKNLIRGLRSAVGAEYPEKLKRE